MLLIAGSFFFNFICEEYVRVLTIDENFLLLIAYSHNKTMSMAHDLLSGFTRPCVLA